MTKLRARRRYKNSRPIHSRPYTLDPKPVETSQYRSYWSPPHKLSFELSLPIQPTQQLQHNLHAIFIPQTSAYTSTWNQPETIRLPPGDGHIANLSRAHDHCTSWYESFSTSAGFGPSHIEAILPVLVVAHREHCPLVPLKHCRLLARQPRPRTRTHTRTRDLRVAIRVLSKSLNSTIKEHDVLLEPSTNMLLSLQLQYFKRESKT